MDAKERIIVPIDTSDIEAAKDMVLALRHEAGIFKFGLEFVSAVFAQAVSPLPYEHLLKRLRHLQELFSGIRCMIDLKLHDIPNTMEGALRAIRALNPAFVTVHASAGPRALERLAKEKGSTKLLAVTALTSLSKDDIEFIFRREPNDAVYALAAMAHEAGADGVVCSPRELTQLRTTHFRGDFLKVTPGVRPAWAETNDQKRIATPAEAIRDGADYLVIGRPITNPPPEIGSPREAVRRIADEIASVVR